MHLLKNRHYTIEQLKGIKLVTKDIGKTCWLVICKDDNNNDEETILHKYNANTIKFIEDIYKLRGYTTNKFYIEGL